MVVPCEWEVLIDATERRNATIPYGIYHRHAELEPVLRPDGAVSWTDEVDVLFSAPSWVLALMGGTEIVRTTGTTVLNRQQRVRTAEHWNMDFSEKLVLHETARMCVGAEPGTSEITMSAEVMCKIWGLSSAVEPIAAHFYKGSYDERVYFDKMTSFLEASAAAGCPPLTTVERRAYVAAGKALPAGVEPPETSA